MSWITALVAEMREFWPQALEGRPPPWTHSGGCGRPGCGLCGDTVQEVKDVSEPTSPYQMLKLAEAKAHELFDIIDLDSRAQKLGQLKADNPVLHALVKHELNELMQKVT